MRQVLGPGALGRPRGIGWRGRWEGGIGMGNTCKPMAVSFQCMTKSTTRKKKEEEEKKLKLTGKKKLIQNVTWLPSFAPQTPADVRTHTACKNTPLGSPPLPPACILQQSPGSQRRQGN